MLRTTIHAGEEALIVRDIPRSRHRMSRVLPLLSSSPSKGEIDMSTKTRSRSAVPSMLLMGLVSLFVAAQASLSAHGDHAWRRRAAAQSRGPSGADHGESGQDLRIQQQMHGADSAPGGRN